MKAKATHIALVVLLLAGTTGVTVSQHVCGSRVRYAELAVNNEHSNCCGDGEMQMSCCYNEIASNKISDEFSQATHTPTVDLNVIGILPVSEFAVDLLSPERPSHIATPSRDDATLYGSGVSISVLNQSFLI